MPASRRIRFLIRALPLYGAIAPMIDAGEGTALGKLIRRRPETVGAVIWPYQCSGWNARERFARIRDHYAVVEQVGGIIDFPVDGKISLLDLGEISEGLKAVVDQPRWFMREGQLAINLFRGETRIYTLAFSLFRQMNDVGTFIGAIQGRDIDGALEGYRELTKAAHGMRPRDLLFELFRMLCCEIGVSRILAVAEDYRHHRDRQYFGEPSAKKFTSNYDEIWTDRGGIRVDPMFFELEVREPKRDLAAIPAKKRGMYRRRFEMLERIKSQLHERLNGHKPQQVEFIHVEEE